MNHHQELLQKIAAGNSTPEERAALSEWLKTLSEQVYHQVLLDYAEIMSQQTVSDFHNAALLEKVNADIARAEQVTLAVPVYRRMWFRYSAAASILVAALLSWYIFSPFKAAVPVATTNIPPGSNKAVLTLANGRQIVLNSAQNGLLGKQGTVQIIKLDSGLLSYQGATTTGEVLYNTIATPRGGQFQVLLPDGSRVWLNAASSLRFPTAFTGADRAVTLTGEAYFEVAQNQAKPFAVTVNNMKVQVLGTSFNIMAYEEEGAVNTTLVSGAVKVNCENNQAVIAPGQQAVLPTGKSQFEIGAANIEAAVAWKEGHFLFDNNDIYTIMRQVGRWYDVEISYQGDLSGITLSGAISRKKYVSQVLDILATTGRVQFEMKDNRIIVMAKQQ